MSAPIYALCAALGFGAAWGIQGVRWNASDLASELAVKEDIAKQVGVINANLTESRAETERSRTEYLEYKKNAESQIGDLERRVTAGPERMYIKAKCPAVPAAGADASGTGGGAAELDATATRAYLDLERGLAEQYSLLQLCRRELRNRSAQKAP